MEFMKPPITFGGINTQSRTTMANTLGKKLKRIAYKEPFAMYIYVDYKVAPAITKKLKKAKLAYIEEPVESNDDIQITVQVTPQTAFIAVEIFDQCK